MPVVARGDVDNQAGCHIVLQNHQLQSERPDPTANSYAVISGRPRCIFYMKWGETVNVFECANTDAVLNAPHDTRIGRLDEAAAARKPVLRWKPTV